MCTIAGVDILFATSQCSVIKTSRDFHFEIASTKYVDMAEDTISSTFDMCVQAHGYKNNAKE